MNILLISYDNDSHIPFFPINLFYLTSHLKAQGHTVGIWPQDLSHGPDTALSQILDENPWDIVGVGAVAGYYQYRKLKALSSVINASRRRKQFQYVLGGHGPAAEPDYFLKTMWADSVVIGDGEDGFDQICNDGARGVIHAHPSTAEPDLETYEDFHLNVYRLIRWPTSTRRDFCMPILSSRGCMYHCSFCYRMREGFYERPVDNIILEMQYLQSNAGITHFQFADELLMSTPSRTAEICEAILSAGLDVRWDCNGRLNHAKPELLRLMRRAGCEYINYGIESLNQQLLNEMHKGLTVARIDQGVKDTIDAGCSPGLNLIWGFPGDTTENLWTAVEFLKAYNPCHELRTIRPVTPYPGTELYRLAIEQGLLDGPADFYERKHVNSDLFTVNFMKGISDDEAHNELCLANQNLAKSFAYQRMEWQLETAADFYAGKNNDFRGWRAV